jgi:ABC-type multidrug transport system ATPase subunit
MSSVEVLADSLSAYAGSILFVSHDRDFIDRFCTHVFAMLPDGRSMLFEGNLDDYKSQARLASFPNVLEIGDSNSKPQNSSISKTSSPNSYAQNKELKKNRDKYKRQITACESTIETLKEKLLKINAELENTHVADHDLLSQLGKKAEVFSQEIESEELNWLEISELLEKLGTD